MDNKSSTKSTKTSNKSGNKSGNKTSDKSKIIIPNSEMDENRHSIFNGRIKTSHPDVAEFFHDLYIEFCDEFFDNDEESKNRMLEFIFGESLEALDKIISSNKQQQKKAKKAKKIKDTQFEAVGLTKPNTAINIFGKEFTKVSKENDVKFTKENSHLTCKNKAWSALGDKEKQIYIDQAKKEKNDYLIAYEKQKNDAIKNGLFRENEIKKPLTSYFQFRAEVRPKLALKFSGKQIDVEVKNLWDKLTEEEKKKYEKAYLKDKAEYDIKQEKWLENENHRLAKLNGNPVDVVIESSGLNKTKTSKNKTEVNVKESDNGESDNEDNETSDNEEAPVKTIQKVDKKTASKKAEAKKAEPKKTDAKKVEAKKAEPKKAITPKSEEESEEEESEEEESEEEETVSKKSEPKKVDAKKVEPKKVEAKTSKSKKT